MSRRPRVDLVDLPALQPRRAPPWRAWPLAVAIVAIATGLGCGTRTVEKRVVDRYGLEILLQSDKKLFEPAVDHGYAQPSNISEERLKLILGTLEIDRQEGARLVRGPAMQAEILGPVAEGLAEAFREADSSQRIAVIATRKQMQKGIFNRKFLTTFVTWIEGEQLVFHLSRSDWPIDDKRQTGLPMPHPDDPQEKFRLVTNEIVQRSGRTGVAVDWRSDAFRTFGTASLARSEPVSDTGQATVAAPASEGGMTTGEASGGTRAPEDDALGEPEPLTNEQLRSLSADDLRALADLEEARSAGRITETEYRRNRTALLDAAAAR